MKHVPALKKLPRYISFAATLALAFGLLGGCAGGAPESSSAAASSSAPPESSAASQPADGPATPQADLPEEIRAMWISYLDWQNADISTEDAMRATAAAMFGNCVDMGLNTVMVAVRPFSDALYKSEVYPWSHLLTGTQGQDPGYDPLAVLAEEAHARDLRIEAWFNPYRVNSPASGLAELSADNPAALHPEWVREINGMWFDPGLPEVQALVVEGAREIAENYDVDGIHIDDYFYPEFTAEQTADGEDKAFDEQTYLEYGVGKPLSTWRRENVSTLVAAVYAAVKEANPTLPFGISPQGNNENNFTMQYSDVKQWLAEPGYADYIMPQIYWGFGYRTSGGREDYAFKNLCEEWAAYPRHESVRLAAGLGAYRIGAGDGGANDQEEWRSGRNLADMVQTLRESGFSGFALFRYDFLYGGEADAELAPQEVQALTALLGESAGDAPAQSSAPSTDPIPPLSSGESSTDP